MYITCIIHYILKPTKRIAKSNYSSQLVLDLKSDKPFVWQIPQVYIWVGNMHASGKLNVYDVLISIC
jgi:hypothetical protein